MNHFEFGKVNILVQVDTRCVSFTAIGRKKYDANHLGCRRRFDDKNMKRIIIERFDAVGGIVSCGATFCWVGWVCVGMIIAELNIFFLQSFGTSNNFRYSEALLRDRPTTQLPHMKPNARCFMLLVLFISCVPGPSSKFSTHTEIVQKSGSRSKYINIISKSFKSLVSETNNNESQHTFSFKAHHFQSSFPSISYIQTVMP